jgi:hypothetical protein
MEGECNKHPDNQQLLLCETCKTTMCEECKKEHNELHDVTSLQDISQKFMRYLDKEEDKELYEVICKLDDSLNLEVERLQKWLDGVQGRVGETVEDYKKEVMNEVRDQSNVKIGQIREDMENALKMSSEEREKTQEEIKDIVIDEKFHLLGKFKDLYFKLQEKYELYKETANAKDICIDHVKRVAAISEDTLKEALLNSLNRVFSIPLLYLTFNRSDQLFTYNIATKEKTAHKLTGIFKANHFDSVLVKNFVYIMGGTNEEGKVPLATTYEYEILGKEGKLKTKTNMVKGRFGHKAISVVDSFIYALGGVTSSFLGTKYTSHCEKYDRIFNRWIEIKPLMESKGYMTACHFRERFIYVFGGFRDDLCLESSANVEIYDTMVESEGWKFVKFNDEGSKWLPVSQGGAIQLNRSSLIIFGGRINKTKFSSDSYIYSIKDNTMKMIESKIESSTTFYQRQVVVYKEQIYAFDGDKNDLHVLNVNEMKWILVKKEEWNKAAPPKSTE